jgi:hypothetical protein
MSQTTSSQTAVPQKAVPQRAVPQRTVRPSLPFLSLLTVLVLLGSACGGDDTSADEEPTPSGDGATGTVAVSIEPVEGFFTEGFEVGFRFETPDGERIASFLWSEAVAAEGSDDLDAFYTTVVDQAVPAGPVVVLATANIGIGPPPETPDLDGDMRCRLDVTVPEGGTVPVQVGFADPSSCLTELG